MILLVAINAKYIHSNLAVYSLKRYTAFCDAGESSRMIDAGVSSCSADTEVRIKEYTINQPMDSILADIYRAEPSVVAFSCYLWNIEVIRAVAGELKKIMPKVRIWAGGPEVSYHPREQLEKYSFFDLIMYGEGERTFKELLCFEPLVSMEGEAFFHHYRNVQGIVYRTENGIFMTEPAAPLALDEIPFPYPWLVKESGMEEEFLEKGYETEKMDSVLEHYASVPDIAHRIVYYESSRGCPFSCSYCLSSIEKGVRFRTIERVKAELSVFLKMEVPQVKFVDRTFNCNRERTLELWNFIKEHDNQVTNFHFEIAADLLTDEEIELLSSMRKHLVQLEIGVQSTNPETVEAIHRTMDLKQLYENVARIHEAGNIHQHLDLIAGLPKEDFETFGKSFDDIYRLHPEQLQLGFLKVLKGALMEEEAEKYQIKFRAYPPYEVLSTHVLSYGELLTLKQVEEMVEIYYNSGQFLFSIYYLEQFFERPFIMYRMFGEWYRKKTDFSEGINRLRRYELLLEFFEEQVMGELSEEKRMSAVPENRNVQEVSENQDAAEVSENQAVAEFFAGERKQKNCQIMKELLTVDLYSKENLKKRPGFAPNREVQKGYYRQFYESEELAGKYLKDFQEQRLRQYGRMTHIEGICGQTAELIEECAKNRHYSGVNYRLIPKEEIWDCENAEKIGVERAILFYYQMF